MLSRMKVSFGMSSSSSWYFSSPNALAVFILVGNQSLKLATQYSSLFIFFFSMIVEPAPVLKALLPTAVDSSPMAGNFYIFSSALIGSTSTTASS